MLLGVGVFSKSYGLIILVSFNRNSLCIDIVDLFLIFRYWYCVICENGNCGCGFFIRLVSRRVCVKCFFFWFGEFGIFEFGW